MLKTGDAVSGQTLDGISFVPALNDGGTMVVRGLLSSQGLAWACGSCNNLKPNTIQTHCPNLLELFDFTNEWIFGELLVP